MEKLERNRVGEEIYMVLLVRAGSINGILYLREEKQTSTIAEGGKMDFFLLTKAVKYFGSYLG